MLESGAWRWDLRGQYNKLGIELGKCKAAPIVRMPDPESWLFTNRAVKVVAMNLEDSDEYFAAWERGGFSYLLTVNGVQQIQVRNFLRKNGYDG